MSARVVKKKHVDGEERVGHVEAMSMAVVDLFEEQEGQ